MHLSSLFKYYQADSVVHHLDGRVKLTFLFFLSLAIILFENPFILLVFWLLSLGFFALAKIPIRKSKYLWIACVMVVLLTALSQGIFYFGSKHHLLVTLISEEGQVFGASIPYVSRWLAAFPGHLAIYQEGIVYGVIQSLRILTLMTVAWTLALTTHPMDLLFALRKFRIPYEFCFLIGLSLRFIPQILDQIQANIQAQKARGFSFSNFSFFDKWLAFSRMFKSVFITLIQSTRDNALAIDLRAFRIHKERTFVKDPPLVLRDKYLIILLSVLTIIIIGGKIIGG